MQTPSRWRSEVLATVRLALPITCGQVGQMLMGVTDSVIVGRLGSTPLAAVALSNSVLNTAMVFGIGLLTSVGVLGSRAHGAGERQELARILRAAFWTSFAVGVALAVGVEVLKPHLRALHPPADALTAAGPYLSIVGWSLVPTAGYFGAKTFCEALGRATAPMWFLFVGVLLNLVLALALVFGWWGLPALGLAGSGWATLIARCFTFVATTFYAASLAGLRPLRLLLPRADVRVTRRLLALGFPVAFQYLSEVAAFNFGAIMMGWLGTVALAAHQIAISCAALTFMVPLGISQAVAVRIGHAVGARALDRVRAIGLSGIGFSGCLMFAFACALWAGREAIAAAFTTDADVIGLAGRLLVVAGAFQLADGVQVTAAGALRGLTDVRVPMVLGYAFYWGLAMPVAYAAAFLLHGGAVGVWVGFAVGLTAAAVTLTVRVAALTRPERLRRVTAVAGRIPPLQPAPGGG